jgi:hypothetical protein
MRKSICLTFCLVLIIAFVAPVQAQDDGKYARFDNRFIIYLGGFFPQTSSEITINGSVANPPPINVEDLLGVEDSSSVLWGGAQWRISRRNSLEFEYFQLNRDGFINLIPNPIAVGDLIIESGSINTALDIGLGRLTYGFSVVRNDRMNIQLKAGLHVADFSTTLQLAGAVCDVSLGQMPPGCPADQSPAPEAEDVTAPLPHFGGSFQYAITPTVTAKFEVIGFAIELDSIDGSLVEIDADIGWYPWKHWGIGAGLRYFNVDVESKGSELNGKFEFGYWGPAVYVAATF